MVYTAESKMGDEKNDIQTKEMERLEKLKQLALAGELDVNEVAEELGTQDTQFRVWDPRRYLSKMSQLVRDLLAYLIFTTFFSITVFAGACVHAHAGMHAWSAANYLPPRTGEHLSCQHPVEPAVL